MNQKEIISAEIERVIYIISGFCASYILPTMTFLIFLFIASFTAIMIKLSVRNYAMTKIDIDLIMAKRMDEIKKRKDEKKK